MNAALASKDSAWALKDATLASKDTTWASTDAALAFMDVTLCSEMWFWLLRIWPGFIWMWL